MKEFLSGQKTQGFLPGVCDMNQQGEETLAGLRE